MSEQERRPGIRFRHLDEELGDERILFETDDHFPDAVLPRKLDEVRG